VNKPAGQGTGCRSLNHNETGKSTTVATGRCPIVLGGPHDSSKDRAHDDERCARTRTVRLLECLMADNGSHLAGRRNGVPCDAHWCECLRAKEVWGETCEYYDKRAP